MEINIEQLESLQYLAKLKGKTVEKFVHAILDEWLTDNFYELSMKGEIKHDLTHVAECRDERGRLLQRESLQIMRDNMRELQSRPARRAAAA